MYKRKELPMLAGIGGFFHWIEELLVILSGPLLTAGLGIGLIDLLSNGKLFFDQPELLYIWAIAMAVGADGQLIGAWARVGDAWSQKAWGAVVGYVILGLILAYVGFIAALVFGFQEAYGITTTEALAKLGMDTVSWLWQRTAVSVGLVCLSGILRYRAPVEQPLSLDAQKKAIAEKMELDALKRQAANNRMQGWIANGRKALQQATGETEGEQRDPLFSNNGHREN